MGEEVKGGREEGRGGKNNGFLPPQSGKSSKSCVLVILKRKKQGETSFSSFSSRVSATFHDARSGSLRVGQIYTKPLKDECVLGEWWSLGSSLKVEDYFGAVKQVKNLPWAEPTENSE
ncbi:unnamed protein product [Prunus armeniaca]|uniref:Uncharacterized protein n=1 Tax=Prunus armeniaca TaxID=36596 RepID=A0A6J5WHY9_PRUAR|nr:unnamed protein product [Prunus armeniaca]